MIRRETYITRKNKQKITRIKMKMKRKKGYRRGKVGEERIICYLIYSTLHERRKLSDMRDV
jgi:hypothetical protein